MTDGQARRQTDDPKFNELQNAITAIGPEVSGLRHSVDGLKADFNRLDTSIQVLATKLDNVTTSFEKTDSHSAKIAALEVKYDARGTEIAGLSKLVYWSLGILSSAIVGLIVAYFKK